MRKLSKIAADTRRKHLQILLDRLTGHADVIRQHLKERIHPYTLGFAAEAGVRDVLRQVLPRRLAVTSGFIRSTSGMLLVPPTTAEVSPQTDIIIYDTLRACPLYSVEGIDVVAAPDVLGVLEVKDSGHAEADLGLTADGYEARKKKAEESSPPTKPKAEDNGALEHIIELAHAAPRAFRGIVLIGGEQAAGSRTRLEFAKTQKNLSPDNVPHVIYGRALEKGDSYIAFFDSADDSVHFNAYARQDGGETDALAAFLRLVAGFFAAQGLTSASISTDMRPSGKRTEGSPPLLSLTTKPRVPSLRDAIREAINEGSASEEYRSHEEMLKAFFSRIPPKTGLEIRSFPALGHDADKIPTSGPRVTVSYRDGEETRRLASFFTMLTAGYLKCVDDTGGAPDTSPWMIHQESIDAYLMRVCELDATVFIEVEKILEEPGLPAPYQPDDEPEVGAIQAAPAEDADQGD